MACVMSQGLHQTLQVFPLLTLFNSLKVPGTPGKVGEYDITAQAGSVHYTGAVLYAIL